MKFSKLFIAPLLLASLGNTGANAQELLIERNLSFAIANEIAQTAMATCKANGYRVTVSVVDRAGELRILLRGDNTNPHTVENSRRKAYTSRTLGIPSAQFAEDYFKPVNTRVAQATLPGFIALGGALPIKAGDEVIGAVGVSGAPGGEKDEVCAKAGIDKVADKLK